MEKSSQSFIFEIQYSLHILTLVVSCSSQSCQASRHGFVALAMSSWALSNSPKRFAAPGGCRKLFPLHAREFPDLFFPCCFFFTTFAYICFLLSLQSIQSISLSSPVTRCHFPQQLSQRLLNCLRLCWKTCCGAHRSCRKYRNMIAIISKDDTVITNARMCPDIYLVSRVHLVPSCRSSCASLSLRSWERKSHQAVELRLRAKSPLRRFPRFWGSRTLRFEAATTIRARNKRPRKKTWQLVPRQMRWNNA